MSTATNTSNRLSEVLKRDKIKNPDRFAGILKNELLFVLRSFMEINDDNISVLLSQNSKGLFEFVIKGISPRLFF